MIFLGNDVRCTLIIIVILIFVASDSAHGYKKELDYIYSNNKEWNLDNTNLYNGNSTRTTGIIDCHSRSILTKIPETGKISFSWMKGSDDCHDFNFFINNISKDRCETIIWSKPNNYSVNKGDLLEWKFEYNRGFDKLCPSYCSEIGWLYIDYIPYDDPIEIKIIFPENNMSVDQYSEFKYLISNDKTIKNCSLYINNNRTDLIHDYPTLDIVKSFDYQFRNFGVRNWHIECCDIPGKCTCSDERIVVVNYPIYYMSFNTIPTVHKNGCFIRLDIECNASNIESVELILNISKNLNASIKNEMSTGFLNGLASEEMNESFVCKIQNISNNEDKGSLFIFIKPDLSVKGSYAISITRSIIIDKNSNILKYQSYPSCDVNCINNECKIELTSGGP